mmetsp:Transcript_79195/g.208475  ORF Transcript_79195/g.208475 Transcript_79195/m.208475 type:complete len:514 (+) Transcript_79195:2-1543(+)
MPDSSLRSNSRTVTLSAQNPGSPQTQLRPEPRTSLQSLIPCSSASTLCAQAENGRGICVEPEKWERKEKWQHVGKGRGAYELMSRFETVGTGKGNFVEVEEGGGSCHSLCSCCCGFLLVLTLLCGVYAGVATWVEPTLPKPWADSPLSKSLMSSLPQFPRTNEYECKVEHSNWTRDWDVEHKSWCCLHEKKACPPDRGYDCGEHVERWNTTWSLGKQHYCCGWTLVGCTATSTTTSTTTLTTTSTKTSTATSTETLTTTKTSTGTLSTTSKTSSMTLTKTTTHTTTVTLTKAKTLTNTHTTASTHTATEQSTTSSKVATTTTDKPTTTTENKQKDLQVSKEAAAVSTSSKPQVSTTLYDCEYQLQKWDTEWSPNKKAYCCTKYDFGCEKTTTRVPYDCEYELEDWQYLWDQTKKDWCCQHEDIGCKDQEQKTTQPPPPMPTLAPKLPSAGCDTVCTLDNFTSSCKDRVQWVVENKLQGKTHACELALGQILHECTDCSACSMEEAGCISPTAV